MIILVKFIRSGRDGTNDQMKDGCMGDRNNQFKELREIVRSGLEAAYRLRLTSCLPLTDGLPSSQRTLLWSWMTWESERQSRAEDLLEQVNEQLLRRTSLHSGGEQLNLGAVTVPIYEGMRAPSVPHQIVRFARLFTGRNFQDCLDLEDDPVELLSSVVKICADLRVGSMNVHFAAGVPISRATATCAFLLHLQEELGVFVLVSCDEMTHRSLRNDPRLAKFWPNARKMQIQ